MKRRALPLIAAVVVLAVALLLVRARLDGRRASGVQMPTAEVTPADFAVTLSAQGVLEAASSLPIVNMGRDTQIVSILRDGARVEAGDIVMTLNDTDVKAEVDRLQQDVVTAEDNVRQQQDQAQRELQNAKSGTEKAQEALRLAKVQGGAGMEKAEAEAAFLEKELAVAQGQLDRRRRLLEQRLLPITEVESAEDEVRDKQFSLETAKRALDRASVDAEDQVRLRELDLSSAALKLEQAEANLASSVNVAKRKLAEKQADLQEAQDQLAAMQVKAPTSGLLLIEQTWEDGLRPLRVGDQVREGQRVANIIQSQEMLARCELEEADIDQVKLGQEAVVRVPAIGSQPLAGNVDSIDNLARQGSPWSGGVPGRRVFQVVIRLTEQDERLRPGMGGGVEIVLERVGTGVAVPVESVFGEGERRVVYAAEGGGMYREIPVEVIERNNELAAVKGDLSEGAVIARRRPNRELIIVSQDGRKRG
jgi:RND family efflux transporter MFP subunit